MVQYHASRIREVEKDLRRELAKVYFQVGYRGERGTGCSLSEHYRRVHLRVHGRGHRVAEPEAEDGRADQRPTQFPEAAAVLPQNGALGSVPSQLLLSGHTLRVSPRNTFSPMVLNLSVIYLASCFYKAHPPFSVLPVVLLLLLPPFTSSRVSKCPAIIPIAPGGGNFRPAS